MKNRISYSVGSLMILSSLAANAQNPNIMVIVCEDIGSYLGCFGDTISVTPNLDRFAGESVRHTSMFTSVGVSAPSRYSLITGRFSSADGANYMRSNFFDKEFEVVAPDGVKCFTEYLRAAGYYCTNNSKTDYQFKTPLSAWDESGVNAHWKNAPQDAPFYSVFNLNSTHESMIWKNSEKELFVDPSKVVVPPYYADNSVVRHDMAVMYSNITRMDNEFGQLYDELKNSGKLESTILIFYSDNGGPLPRAKREIMDSGTRVPFMIRFPNGDLAGTINEDLNMFVDIPATILSLAGLEVLKNIHGQAMYGQAKGETRKYVFGATDRFDEQVEKRASIRDSRFLYIKNYMDQQSVYRPVEFRLQMPMMRNLLELYNKGELNAVQRRWFESPSASEELYDCFADPHNINNLANDPNYISILKKMRSAFESEWIEKFNKKWVSYSEADFVKEMHPNGVKPQCPTPVCRLENGLLVVEDLDDNYSIVYRTKSDNKWNLYTKPLTCTSGNLLFKSCRIGYLDSEEIVIDNNMVIN